MKEFSKPFAKPADNFVLEYGHTGERTSIITPELIVEAIEQAQTARSYVTLICCTPPKMYEGRAMMMKWGYLDKDCDTPSAAIFFTEDSGDRTQYNRAGFSPKRAADLLCAFFEHSTVPPLYMGWDKYWLVDRPEDPEPYILYAGNDEFKHFDLDDVLAALDQLYDGEINSVMLQTESAENGYLEISAIDGAYMAELQTDDDVTGKRRGFRLVTGDKDQIQQWMTDFYTDRKPPEITPEWDEFDVEEFFNNIANKS